MWNPFRKKKDSPPPSPCPSLTLTVDPVSGNVSPHAHLGHPRSAEEARLNATAVARLTFLLNGGRFLASLQQAIGVAGERDRMEAVAHWALGELHSLLMEAASTEQSEAAPPLVPPTKAFDPRPQGIPANG